MIKHEILHEFSKNGASEACRIQLFPGTLGFKKRTARNVLFMLVEYHKMLLSILESSDVKLSKEGEVPRALHMPLRKAEGSEELKVSS